MRINNKRNQQLPRHLSNLAFLCCVVAMLIIASFILYSDSLHHTKMKSSGNDNIIIDNKNNENKIEQNNDNNNDKDDEVEPQSDVYLPPSVYAAPVTISDFDQHHRKGSLRNINKHRVVLFDTDDESSSSSLLFRPSFAVHSAKRKNNIQNNNNNNNTKKRIPNTIRFLVVGDWGGPGRQPQKSVASLMARVATVADWENTFVVPPSSSASSQKRLLRRHDSHREHDDNSDNSENEDRTDEPENLKKNTNNNHNDRLLLFSHDDGDDSKQQEKQEEEENVHDHHARHNNNSNNKKKKRHQQKQADEHGHERDYNNQQAKDNESSTLNHFLSSFPPIHSRPGSEFLDFIVGTGDNMYESGAANEFDPRFKRNFEHVYSDESLSHKIWFQCLGNHDVFSHGVARDASGQIRYMLRSPNKRWWMPATYYAHEYSLIEDNHNHRRRHHPLLFILFLHIYEISGALTQMSKTQIKWLESRLKRTRATHRVVVGHRPIFSAGKKHGSSKYMQNLLLPLFERYNVSVYFCGDDHQMQVLKKDGLMTRFVVSGAGARLEPLSSKVGGVPETIYQRKQFGFVSVEVSQEKIRLVVHHLLEEQQQKQTQDEDPHCGTAFVHEIISEN